MGKNNDSRQEDDEIKTKLKNFPNTKTVSDNLSITDFKGDPEVWDDQRFISNFEY